jgi:hypothetical protein
MTKHPLSKEITKKFVVGGKLVVFKCNIAFTTKREADNTASEIRRMFEYPCRVVKGKGGMYYPYFYGVN